MAVIIGPSVVLGSKRFCGITEWVDTVYVSQLQFTYRLQYVMDHLVDSIVTLRNEYLLMNLFWLNIR